MMPVTYWELVVEVHLQEDLVTEAKKGRGNERENFLMIAKLLR